MPTKADIRASLVTLFTGKPGLVTVLPFVPVSAPGADLLPLLFLDERAARTTSTSHRRTMHWPFDIYLFAAIKSEDTPADMTAADPWSDIIVGWLDQKVSLGGLLAGSYQWDEPMMEDPGPIRFLNTVYFGCLLHPIFPIKVEKEFVV